MKHWGIEGGALCVYDNGELAIKLDDASELHSLAMLCLMGCVYLGENDLAFEDMDENAMLARDALNLYVSKTVQG